MSFFDKLRLAKFFYDQRCVGFPPPIRPHFDDDTLAEFENLLRKSKCYLEFGSGGSTIFADRAGVETVTVECDRFYARSVTRALSESTKVKIIVVDIGVTSYWGEPIFRKLTPARLARWREYSSAPFVEFSRRGHFPNLVLVDGRFRRACVLETMREAARAAASVTILLDDYEGRDHYRQVEEFLGEPRRVGRSAVFEFDGASPSRLPDETVMAAANADFR